MMTRWMVVVALAALALAGCKGEDEFAGVKPLKASSVASASSPRVAPKVAPKAAPTAGVAPGAVRAGALKPGATMPADHPPIQQGGAPPSDLAPRPRQPVTANAPDTFGTTGPLRWVGPEGWQATRPSSQMRLAEYIVPGPSGQEPGVVSIFYFGAGQGGSVEANIDRWVKQFTTVDGEVKRKTRTVNGLTVYTVDVSGTFGGGMGGGGAKAGQRMLGAIAMSAAGPFFFKLVGPKATIDPNVGRFDQLVSSFKPGT